MPSQRYELSGCSCLVFVPSRMQLQVKHRNHMYCGVVQFKKIWTFVMLMVALVTWHKPKIGTPLSKW